MCYKDTKEGFGCCAFVVGIQPNPGLVTCNTPAGFKNMSVLHILHINACSLLPQLDLVRIWAVVTVQKKGGSVEIFVNSNRVIQVLITNHCLDSLRS